MPAVIDISKNYYQSCNHIQILFLIGYAFVIYSVSCNKGTGIIKYVYKKYLMLPGSIIFKADREKGNFCSCSQNCERKILSVPQSYESKLVKVRLVIRTTWVLHPCQLQSSSCIGSYSRLLSVAAYVC